MSRARGRRLVSGAADARRRPAHTDPRRPPRRSGLQNTEDHRVRTADASSLRVSSKIDAFLGLLAVTADAKGDLVRLLSTQGVSTPKAPKKC